MNAPANPPAGTDRPNEAHRLRPDHRGEDAAGQDDQIARDWNVRRALSVGGEPVLLDERAADTNQHSAKAKSQKLSWKERNRREQAAGAR